MGAYFKLNANGHDPCIVTKQDIVYDFGWNFGAGLPSGFGRWEVHKWNSEFPAYRVPVPANCPVPPGSQPAPTPTPNPTPHPTQNDNLRTTKPVITGPGAKCDPPMSQRTDGDRVGFETEEHLRQPLTGKWLGWRLGASSQGAAAEPALTGIGEFTAPYRIVVDPDGTIRVVDVGSGPGGIAFAPPEFNEFMLRGDGVHPDGTWPDKISRAALTIVVGAGHADHARNILAFGLPSARSVFPQSGWFFDLDPSTGKLWARKTDANCAVTNSYDLQAIGTIVTDHGALGGLGDDDHTQYMLDAGVSVAGNFPSFVNADGRTMVDSGLNYDPAVDELGPVDVLYRDNGDATFNWLELDASGSDPYQVAVVVGNTAVAYFENNSGAGIGTIYGPGTAGSGYRYQGDPDTGLIRSAANEQTIQCGGNDTIVANASGADINGDLTVDGKLTVTGDIDPTALITVQTANGTRHRKESNSGATGTPSEECIIRSVDVAGGAGATTLLTVPVATNRKVSITYQICATVYTTNNGGTVDDYSWAEYRSTARNVAGTANDDNGGIPATLDAPFGIGAAAYTVSTTASSGDILIQVAPTVHDIRFTIHAVIRHSN